MRILDGRSRDIARDSGHSQGCHSLFQSPSSWRATSLRGLFPRSISDSHRYQAF